MRMIVQLGWRKVEPAVFAGKEEPRRFFQLLCRGISEEIISSSKAAQLYGMKLAAFRKELLRIEPLHNPTNQLKISFTTRPCTSVNLKRRP